MANIGSELSYYEDASLNATFLLQKHIFQFQTHSLQQLMNDVANSKVFISSDMKVPSILLNRTLGDEYSHQGRLLDNEEITLLGLLDQTGKIGVSSRLNELMLMMTRVTKTEHRGLCIYLLLEKLSDDCANDFSKFGGLRIVKRWLRIAEENDRVPEMTVLVKLCNKLPFNELAVKEVGIGKIIRKLLKFQSPSGSDVTNLHAEIEKLMANWRAKQMEIVSNRALQNAVTETAHAAKVTSSDKPLSGLVLAISDRLTQQRGHPTTATPHSQDMAHQRGVDSNESKGDSVMVKNEYAPFRHSIQNSLPSPRVANSNNSPTGSTATSRLDLHRSSNSAEGSDAMRNTTHRPVSVLPMLQRAGAASAAPVPQVDSASSAPARVVGLDLTSTSAAPATPTPLAVVKPPMAVRERKPLDMAESARKLLAMRAQQAQPAGLGTDGNGSPVHSYTSSEPPMSPSTANVLSILSAVGKARIASGLMPQPIQKLPAVVLKSAMKKSAPAVVPAEEGAAAADSTNTAASSPTGAITTNMTTAVPSKKEKKAIHWADENGGLLREVRTIEVAKIKRSTAHYSSTRELSKRERMAEKETHLSKAEDAMQKNTEWRTPAPLQLSIVVLDNITIVADSAEKVAQEKRLAHVLEARYVDDPLIPADPDEAASIYEVINSSGTSGNNQYATGTSAGDDTECAAIPWYMPGTEPPPEQELPPPATDPLSVLASGAYLDDNALQKIIIQLPYSLQALDFSALRALVQDPAALQSVLRPDGSVDEFNLSTFQRNLNGGGGGGVGDRERMSRFDSYHGGDMGSSGPPVFLPPGDLNGPNSRRSRFRDAGPEPMMIDNYGGGGYGPSGQPYDFDYDPYGPPRNGRYDDRPPLDWNPDYGDAYLPPRAEPLPLMGGAPRRGAPAQSRFTSTKAATPCRFFNTAKGCQFGDKCSFGHFLPPSDLPPAGPMDVYMPPDAGPHQDRSSRWGGGGPSAGPGGPGRRFSGPGDRHAGAGGPGPAMGPGMGGRSGPGSRLHSQFSAPPSAAPHLTTVPIPMAGTQLLEGMPPIGMDPVGAGPSKRAKRFN